MVKKDSAKLKRSSPSEHHSEHKKKLTALWVGLIVLVVAVAVLYPFVKDGVVGQAIWQAGQPAPVGDYWGSTNEPLAVVEAVFGEDSCSQRGIEKTHKYTLQNAIDGDGVNLASGGTAPGYCCPQRGDFCIGPKPQMTFEEYQASSLTSGTYCYSVGSLFSKYVSTKKELCVSNNIDPDVHATITVECDDTQIPGIYQNLPSDVGNKFLCSENQWHVCDSNFFGIYEDDNSYFCDATQWHVCDDSVSSMFCKNNKWLFDVPKEEFENPQGIFNGFVLEGIGVLPNGGSTAADPVDIIEKQGYFGFLSITTQKSFFRYGDTIFQKKMANPTEAGAVTLSVSSAGPAFDITLTVDPEDKYAFSQEQFPLDLDGDTITDAYLSVLLASPYLDKSILFSVTTVIDFDQTNMAWTGVLLSDNSQTFVSNGVEHTMGVFGDESDVIFTIDGRSFGGSTATTDVTPNPIVGNFFGGNFFIDEQETEEIFFVARPIVVGDGGVIFRLTKTQEEIRIGTTVGEDQVDLAQTYEESFSKDIILDVATNNLGFVSVCSNDPPVLSALTVCDRESQILNIQNKKASTLENVLFWYEQPAPDQTKEGSVLYRRDVTDIQNEFATIFATNMVAGKRMALSYEGHDYVIRMNSLSNYLDLTTLKLRDITEPGFPEYVAEGDQSEVVFNLPLGKQINIKLDLEPELNYDFSAKTTTTKQVDLENEFETYISTYSQVDILNFRDSEAYRKIKIDPSDINILKDIMQINYNGVLVELNFSDAKPNFEHNGKVLFYYSDFTNGGISGALNTFNKYAHVFFYSNLRNGPYTHEFTDTNFILPLVKGKRLAFGLDDQYYLLTYADPWTGTEAEGFELSKMRITNVDGSNPIAPTMSGLDLVFDLGERRIEAKVQTGDVREITFTGISLSDVTSELELAAISTGTFSPRENFSATLLAGVNGQRNNIQIGSNTYEICDSAAAATLVDFVGLCSSNEIDLTLDRDVLYSSYISGVLVQYHGKNTEGQKVVTFKHTMNLTDDHTETFDWLAITDNLQNNRNPAIFWEDTWFELEGSQTLDTFQLVELPRASSFSTIQMNTTTSEAEGREAGTIVFDNGVLAFQKKFVGESEDFRIDLDIEPLQRSLLTLIGFNVTEEQQPTSFMTNIDGHVYSLSVDESPSISDFVKVTITEEGKLIYVSNLPVDEERHVLLSNGNVVKIHVLDADIPTIHIQK